MRKCQLRPSHAFLGGVSFIFVITTHLIVTAQDATPQPLQVALNLSSCLCTNRSLFHTQQERCAPNDLLEESPSTELSDKSCRKTRNLPTHAWHRIATQKLFLEWLGIRRFHKPPKEEMRIKH